MKKQILLFALMLLPLVANAFTGEAVVDGIKYYIVTKGQMAEVRANSYTGDIVIPETIEYDGVTCKVTAIGNYAFHNCLDLTSVIIGNNVITIGDYAFDNCQGLTSVTFGNSLTTFGIYSFYRCVKLVSLEIPNGVTSIGERAFEDCSSVNSISLPSSLTEIGKAVLAGCNGLTSVVLPNSLTTIGNNLFTGCENLVSVTLPNNLTSISKGAFQGCHSLKGVTIPNSVTEIVRNAFYDCRSLTSIEIPNNVTSIGEYAFYGCSSLKVVTLGNSVTSIINEAFANCGELTDFYCYAEKVPDSYNSTFNNSEIGYATLHVPNASVENYKKTSPWSGFGTIVGLDVSTFIGEAVVDGIKYYINAIDGTAEVRENSPKYSGDIVIPETIEYDGVTCKVSSIGNYAFRNCSGLASVIIPNSVTSIGKEAFYNCSGLTSIDIPDGVKSISENMFHSCSSLISINLPEGVTSFDLGAFACCTSLSTINIPDGVSSIGSSAFYDCSSLTSIKIPDGVSIIDSSVFYNCSSLTSINIPNGVTSIGEYAFHGCSGLTSITIPGNVTSIGGGAFRNVDFESVISFVEEPFAIIGVSSLEKTFSQNTFNNATLYVPNGTVSKYRSTGGWRDFANIEEMSDGTDDELTLTIQDAQEGKVKLLVKAGDIFTFQIEPEGGWTIHSVTYNDEDITSELDSENKFTTPAILESAVLNISYEQTIPTDAKWSNTENLKVRCNSSRVVVSGISEGLPILVYNTDGQLVGSASSTLGATMVETTLNNGDVAIVKVGDKAVKLVME